MTSSTLTSGRGAGRAKASVVVSRTWHSTCACRNTSRAKSAHVVLPPPATIEAEIAIVETRVASLGRAFEIPAEPPGAEQIRRVVTIFRELREGVTVDGKAKVKQPSGTLSTAEAISVVGSGLALAAHFGDGRLSAHDLVSGIAGAVVKDPVQDAIVWREYLETVVKERDGWKDFYKAARASA